LPKTAPTGVECSVSLFLQPLCGYVNVANAFDATFSSASTAEVEMAYEGKSVTFTPVVSESNKLGL